MNLLIDKENHVTLTHKNGAWILSEERGFSPLDTLIGATAACSTYVLKGILNKQKINYTIQRVQANYEEGTSRPLEQIDILFYLSVDDSDKEKVKKDLQLVPKHCTVARCLDPAIKINEQVEFL